MKQLPLRIAEGPSPTLDNFVVGANAAALQALEVLCTRPLPSGSLYLWGPTGAGKTHLLAALGSAARARGEPVLALGPDTLPWSGWPEGTTLATIDGCDELDAAGQHAAFAAYVEAAGAGVPVVAAGRLPPVDLPVREDLRTRLGSGLVFRLQPLGEREALEVLAREAGRRGILLSDEVTGYLLTRFARDLGSLMGLLDALDEFSLSEKRSVTVPLLRRMLSERPPGSEPPEPALWAAAPGAAR